MFHSLVKQTAMQHSTSWKTCWKIFTQWY